MKTSENAGTFGSEFFACGVDSLDAVSKDAQAISAAASEYARQACEAGSSTMQQLMAANSLDKAVEIQSAYFRQSYEHFVAGASRLSGLYADMAKNAYRPFEAAVVRSR